MPPQEEFWDKCLDIFDPGEVLVGQRGESLYCERGHSPFQDLRNHFRPSSRSSRPSIAFFSGHRGSGKSSLLLRLLADFTDDYFVVYFDIEHNLDSRNANQIDLLYLLGATIYRVAQEEGIGVNPELLQGLANSVFTIAHQTKENMQEALDVGNLVEGLVCFGANMLGAGIGSQLAQAALRPFKFSSGVSKEVAGKREIEPQVQNIINQVNLIIADLQGKAKKNLLVVVDGLDKLQHPEQVDLVFLQSRALFGPVCRIIYTLPMVAFTSIEFGQAEGEARSYILPNIKLFEETCETTRDQQGYGFLREVVSKRLKAINQSPDDVFEPEALELLIFKSGGVMRDFIRLIQDAIGNAKIMALDKVDLIAAQNAVDERIVQLSMRLTQATIEELRDVRKYKRPSGTRESRALLHGLFILAYRNRTTWFDVHPILWEEL